MDEPRRGQRDRRSRVVLVDGHPVLISNLYDLEGGEPSVFARELSKVDPKDFGAVLAEKPANVPLKKNKVKPEKDKSKTSQGRPATALQTHNEAVRACHQESSRLQKAYLRRHVEKLEPFVTASVARSIRSSPNLPDSVREPVTQQPESIRATLREYQLEGLAWLVAMHERGANAILADEMGLGKTLQTIAFLAALKARGVGGPHLVVVPLSVVSSWMNELKRWCPELRAVRVHSSDPSERMRLRKEALADPGGFDVAVTTYEMVRAGDVAGSLVWRYLVLDEGHRIKNEESLTAAALRRVRHEHVLLLTGTPIQNNLHELYALLSFLYPDVFTDCSLFDRAFNLSGIDGTNTPHVDAVRIEAAHVLLKPFMLRRLKSEVEVNLPPCVETKISCPLTEMQTFWYRRLLLANSTLLRQLESEAEQKPGVKFDKASTSWSKLMSLLMQLRKVANHPFCFKDAEPDFNGDTSEEIVTACGKMDVLDRLLLKLRDGGHRVVLFSQFKMMLDILEDYARLRGFTFLRLDGGTNRVQRTIDMEIFNKPGSPVFLYLLCTRAGGLGINLQTADTAILYDSDWNPQWDLQAMARVHRIGQTRPVHVYRLMTGGTVEERIAARAEAKLYLDTMVNRGGVREGEEAAASMENMGTSEMLSMLKFGCDRIFSSPAGQPPTDAELDAILDRSTRRAAAAAAGVKAEEEGKAEGGVKLLEGKRSAADFTVTAPLSTFILKGEDYCKVRNNASMRDIAAEWRQTAAAKRQRKSTLLNIDGYDVLAVNNYSMQQGGISAARVGAGNAVKLKRRAGIDFMHMEVCLNCWDGGELLCCDACPAAYHLSCIGLRKAPREGWSCPHHACTGCARRTVATGMLLRCEVCPSAYCEDCRPLDMEYLQDSELFDAHGMVKASSACYVVCGQACVDFKQQHAATLTDMIADTRRQVARMRQAAATEEALYNARHPGRKLDSKTLLSLIEARLARESQVKPVQAKAEVKVKVKVQIQGVSQGPVTAAGKALFAPPPAAGVSAGAWWLGGSAPLAAAGSASNLWAQGQVKAEGDNPWALGQVKTEADNPWGLGQVKAEGDNPWARGQVKAEVKAAVEPRVEPVPVGEGSPSRPIVLE